MMEVPRKVKKYGSSWVILLDKQTRQLLNIKEIGETLILKKVNPNDPNPDKPESEDDIGTYE